MHHAIIILMTPEWPDSLDVSLQHWESNNCPRKQTTREKKWHRFVSKTLVNFFTKVGEICQMVHYNDASVAE